MIPVKYHRQRELNTYSAGFAPRDYPIYHNSLWQGCIGAWCPSLGITGNRLHDWSIYKNDIILTNTSNDSCWTVSDGRRSLLFDGSDDYGISEKKIDYNLGDTASISFWFNQVASGVSSKGLFVLADAGYDDGIAISAFDIVSGTIFVYWKSPSPSVALSTTQLGSLNRWYHFALVNVNGSITCYINGNFAVPVYTGTSGGALSGSKWIYFAAFGSSLFLNNCYLDDVRLYNRPLTSNEIRTLARHRAIAYEPLMQITHHQPQEKVEKTPSFYWNERSLANKSGLIYWNSRSIVSNLDTLRWNALYRIDSIRSYRWNSYHLISLSDSLLWNTRKTVVGASQEIWNVNSLINKNSQSLWDVKKLVVSDDTLRWNVLVSISKDRQLLWNAKATISDSISSLWNSLLRVNDSIDIRHDVLSRISDSVNVLYSINSRLEKQRSYLWNTRGLVQDVSQLSWNTRQATQANSSLKWDVLRSLEKTSQELWSVLATIDKGRNILFDVRAKIENDSNIFYNVNQSVERLNDIRFNVCRSIDVLTVLRWNLSKEVDSNIDLYYNVYSVISKSSEIYWDIAVYLLVNSIHEIILRIQNVDGNILHISTAQNLVSNISRENLSTMSIAQKQELIAQLTEAQEILLRRV